MNKRFRWLGLCTLAFTVLVLLVPQASLANAEKGNEPTSIVVDNGFNPNESAAAMHKNGLALAENDQVDKNKAAARIGMQDNGKPVTCGIIVAGWAVPSYERASGRSLIAVNRIETQHDANTEQWAREVEPRLIFPILACSTLEGFTAQGHTNAQISADNDLIIAAMNGRVSHRTKSLDAARKEVMVDNTRLSGARGPFYLKVPYCTGNTAEAPVIPTLTRA